MVRIISCRTYEEFLVAFEQVESGDQVIIVNAAHCSVEEFRSAMRAARGLIGDFDGTFHIGNQWADVREMISPVFLAEAERELRAYLEGDTVRTDRDDIRFLLNSVGRLVGSGIHTEDFLTAARGRNPREGTAELINSFGDPLKFGDHVCVVSFGLYDYIDFWFHTLAGSRRSLVTVMALRLKWAGDGLLDGCDVGTVVTDGNKGYMADVFRAQHKLEPDETVVVGDAPTDFQMMHPDNIGVLVVPHFDPEKDREKYRNNGLPKLWPRVSAVLVSDSLMPLARLRSGK